MTKPIAQPTPVPAPASIPPYLWDISLTWEPGGSYTLSGLDPVALVDMISALRADAARGREYLSAHPSLDGAVARYFSKRADSVQGLADRLDACRRALCIGESEEVSR